jgi:hypothetical protein
MSLIYEFEWYWKTKDTRHTSTTTTALFKKDLVLRVRVVLEDKEHKTYIYDHDCSVYNA